MGQYGQALPLLQRCLAIFEKASGPDHPDTAASLNLLGLLYDKMGETGEAFRLFQRSLVIYLKVLGPEHPVTANSLNNLATQYLSMGQYEKALPLLQRSITVKEKMLGAEHPLTATGLSNIGYLYMSMRKFSDSEVMFHESVTRAQGNPGARETLWKAQYGLTLLYKNLNHGDLAILWGKEAVNTIQNLRTELTSLDKELKSSFLDDKRPVYQDLADLLISDGRILEAQEVLQMLKEQEFYDSLQRSAKTDPRSTRIELTGLERKLFTKYYELQDQQVALGNEREQLERKQQRGEMTPAEQQRLNEINKEMLPPLREAMKAFLKNLQKESDQYIKNKDYRQNELSITLTETNLQKVLVSAWKSNPSAKVVALQYVVTDTRLSILLSTPGAPPLARQIEIDGKALRTQIFTVRARLSNSQSDRDLLKKDLSQLYAQLIAPIEKDLKAIGAGTLLLVPNDVLRYVPFAALYDGEHYLVETYRLTLFNEAVKKDFVTGATADWHVAAMGLTRAVENLPALTAVREELNAITLKSGLKGTAYLDDAFTRAVLTRALGQNFNVLHLASHFVFVAGRPEASRIFLGDRSALYLGDIARENLRFDRFALVTFSACESGLGGGLDADGRDMESLGALVQNQGAQTVMATLWKVEDTSTATLMETFYRAHHDNNLGKSEALRAAQMKFIKRGAGVLGHPYYWAPFVLMGDWR